MSDNIVIDIVENVTNVNVGLSTTPDNFVVDAFPGGAVWGNIIGTLSAQSDLWRYLSAETFSPSQLTAYLASHSLNLCSIDVKGQLLSAGADLFDIFLTAETDAQTLSFNNNSEVLSISNGNSVTLSSIRIAANNFTSNNFLSLSGGLVQGPVQINNNLTVFGNLTASGTTTFANTIFTTTSSLSVVHLGTGPALYVGNYGNDHIATFVDLQNGLEMMHIGGLSSEFPNVGIKTGNPNKDFTVRGEISASGTIYDNTGNSTQWNTAYNIGTAYQNASSTFLTAETDSQTLSYIPSSFNLSISNGNTVSLSSFNTTLNTVSALLTPITTTRTLTGQLVTNTTFQNTTAILLPTSIYQGASGNWQNTFTTVQSNSSNWNTAWRIGGFTYKVLSPGETTLNANLYNIFYAVVTGSNDFTFTDFTTGQLVYLYLSANHEFSFRQYFPTNTIIQTGDSNTILTYDGYVTRIIFQYIDNQYIGIANTIQTNIPSISSLGYIMLENEFGFILQEDDDKLLQES
jgi:hypothetical protein